MTAANPWECPHCGTALIITSSGDEPTPRGPAFRMDPVFGATVTCPDCRKESLVDPSRPMAKETRRLLETLRAKGSWTCSYVAPMDAETELATQELLLRGYATYERIEGTQPRIVYSVTSLGMRSSSS
jgi:hypothetical protein